MSRAKVLGTHRFVGWIVCNHCGRKWHEEDFDRAEVRAHVIECMPDLAVLAPTANPNGDQ